MATQLEAKLRDHLKARNNLFNEASGGLASSLNRPLLCLFDRNFELSVVLQVLFAEHQCVPIAAYLSANRRYLVSTLLAIPATCLPRIAPLARHFTLPRDLFRVQADTEIVGALTSCVLALAPSFWHCPCLAARVDVQATRARRAGHAVEPHHGRGAAGEGWPAAAAWRRGTAEVV